MRIVLFFKFSNNCLPSRDGFTSIMQLVFKYYSPHILHALMKSYYIGPAIVFLMCNGMICLIAIYFLAMESSTHGGRTGAISLREKDLIKKLKSVRNTVRRVKKGRSKLQQTLKTLKKHPAMLEQMQELNETTLNFIVSQLENQPKKPKGRRFTMDDKVFSLSLMKQSGKAYKYLRRIFALPAQKTLQNLLNNLPFSCGINEAVFQQLKYSVDKMKPLQRNCVLIDEIALSTGLEYDQKSDSIKGFVDFGGAHKRPAFADHALVFMIKGVYRKWKQPTCYCYTEGTVSKGDLVRMIKEVVRNVRKTGLNVVASVCDQGATNVAAVNALLHDTNAECLRRGVENRYHGYTIDGDEVIHLYDYPHLMKGIRNALLTKDLSFTQNGREKIASWQHVVDAYRVDQKLGLYSQFVKLTDEHILPEKIKKMSVRHCTQVFSHKVASAIKARALISQELQPSSQFYLDPAASDTSDLLLFFDQLFDSVNGSQLRSQDGKTLRSAVTDATNHIPFWESSIVTLKSMYFTAPGSTKPVRTPSLKNWIFTLQSFIYLWRKVRGIGFKFLTPRAFNQDPLENFFSCVRGYAGANAKPTPTSFAHTTKALLVNNLVSPRAIGANCEDDGSLSYLDNLKSFLNTQVAITETPLVLAPVYPPEETVQLPAEDNMDLATAYVSGVIGKKLRKKLPACQSCQVNLETEEDLPEHMLIRVREYAPHALVRPSVELSQAVDWTTRLFFSALPHIITTYNIKKRLLDKVDINSPIFTNLFCAEHSVSNTEILLRIILNFVLYFYVSKVNNILKGTDLRYKNLDPLTKLAFVKYGKSRKGPKLPL
jgi:hypothetical protein